MTVPAASTVGAVVIGRNEGARLIGSLNSLLGSCKGVVYVDSGSTDGSVAAAMELGASVVHLDLSTPFTAARARNAGFKRLVELHPSIEMVQFVDGDCEVVPGWLEAATSFLYDRKDVAVVCGRRMERHPTSSIYNAMCDHEWNTPVGPADACGGDFLIRTEAFRKVQGFSDGQIAHEEPELCGRLRKAGYNIWRIKEPMTLHDAAIHRFGQFYTRNRRAGFGISQALLQSNLDNDPGAVAIIRRALIWAVLIPFATAVAVLLVGSLGLVLLTAYPIQVWRQALMDKHGAGGTIAHRLQVAGLYMLGKFAEAHGAIEFLAKDVTKTRITAIYYK